MLFNLQGAYRFAVVFATAYLIYHTFNGLSRTFLKFFNFLFSSSLATATACISYHIASALSIPFLKLFSSFFHLLFQVFTSPHLRQPIYITIYFPFCQALLHNFFDIFWLFSTIINLYTPFHSISTDLYTICILFSHQKFGFRTVEDAAPYFSDYKKHLSLAQVRLKTLLGSPSCNSPIYNI